MELAIAVGENSSSDQPLSNAQRAQLRQLVGSWLLQPAADMADPLAPLQLTSMRLVRETLLTAKVRRSAASCASMHTTASNCTAGAHPSTLLHWMTQEGQPGICRSSCCASTSPCLHPNLAAGSVW